MLRGLDIRDMLIIDRLELEFQPGLNALTGETGAGKSILLDSLGFVLGWRGRAELVRTGADQGEVQAWFDLPDDHAAHAILDEAGLPKSDELILRRINTRDGRKTAWVNDRRVSGDVLRQLSETLVELHGQHDDRGLLNASGHRQLLDSFGKSTKELAATKSAWRQMRDAKNALETAESEVAALKAEEEFLRHAVGELDALDPQSGEEATLDQRRRLMQSAERIREDIVRAFGAIGLDGAEGQLNDATRWLEGAAASAEGTLDDAIAALGRALNELGEAEDSVRRALDALQFDPSELEHTEERLFAIRALARKHGQQPDDLSVFAAKLRQKLQTLDRGGDQLVLLQRELRDAEAKYDKAALALTAARTKSAGKLDAAMAKELAPLKMERAVFKTAIAIADDGPEGRDAVTFTVATNPGAPSGPLNKIASGGELSRFLLALKVCLTSGTPGLTMIFDEIDRGVGGATANAVGRRLSDLAEGAQILVVTHSPQVAALAGHHWRVEKSVAKNSTTSTVVPLAPADRIDEIARMLAGDVVTDEARGAAKALLAS